MPTQCGTTAVRRRRRPARSARRGGTRRSAGASLLPTPSARRVHAEAARPRRWPPAAARRPADDHPGAPRALERVGQVGQTDGVARSVADARGRRRRRPRGARRPGRGRPSSSAARPSGRCAEPKQATPRLAITGRSAKGASSSYALRGVDVVEQRGRPRRRRASLPTRCSTTGPWPARRRAGRPGRGWRRRGRPPPRPVRRRRRRTRGAARRRWSSGRDRSSRGSSSSPRPCSQRMATSWAPYQPRASASPTSRPSS